MILIGQELQLLATSCDCGVTETSEVVVVAAARDEEE